MPRNGQEIDLALSGRNKAGTAVEVGFRLASAQDLPRGTETIPVQKEQFDTEADPGEQSLSGWWRRSQASLHLGAGALYQELQETNEAFAQFWDGEHLDLSKPGEVKCSRAWKYVADGYSVDSWKLSTYRFNHFKNPSFEYATNRTTGWTVNAGTGDSPTITAVTAENGVTPYHGSYMGKYTFTYSGATPISSLQGSLVSTPEADTDGCNISVWVWTPTGAPSLKIEVRKVSDGSTIGSSSDRSTAGAWSRISAPFNPAAGETYVAIIYASVDGTTPTGTYTYYVDAALALDRGFNDSVAFFDGDSPGAEWLGTPQLTVARKLFSDEQKLVYTTNANSFYAHNLSTGTNTFLFPGSYELTAQTWGGDRMYYTNTLGLHTRDVLWLAASPGYQASNIPIAAVAWGKYRLWACGGRQIHQPILVNGWPQSLNTIFSNPDFGWNYTCIAEGPAAMYFGGHNNTGSTIAAIGLSADGSIPTLSGARLSAAFPQGELVQKIAVLGGSYLGIGTNKGFRVSTIDGENMTYGPLIFTPEGVTECTSVVTNGRFFYVAFRTAAEGAVVYCVDTGTPLNDGIFPYWKYSVVPGEDNVISMAWAQDRLGVACENLTAGTTKVYVEEAAKYAAATLQVSRVRFRTTENKLFKGLTLEAKFNGGTIKVDVIEENGTEWTLGTFSDSNNPSYIRLENAGTPLDPQKYISLRFTLTPATGGATAPILNSYVVHALPAVQPQRMFTLPLLCFDQETAASGQRYGRKDFAIERLRKLQELEDRGDIVTFTDYTEEDSVGNPVAHEVIIESVRFIETSTPPVGAKGRGGVIVLILRTAAA